MKRIVIELGGAVAPDGAQFMTVSLEEPVEAETNDVPLQCKVDDAEFAALKLTQPASGSVKTAGGKLFQALAGHAQIGQYLQTALQTPVGDRYPVFVKIATRA